MNLFDPSITANVAIDKLSTSNQSFVNSPRVTSPKGSVMSNSSKSNVKEALITDNANNSLTTLVRSESVYSTKADTIINTENQSAVEEAIASSSVTKSDNNTNQYLRPQLKENNENSDDEFSIGSFHELPKLSETNINTQENNANQTNQSQELIADNKGHETSLQTVSDSNSFTENLNGNCIFSYSIYTSYISIS